MRPTIAILALAAVLFPAIAPAAVLCVRKHGPTGLPAEGAATKLRSVACKAAEVQVDPVALGLQGPAGPQGSPGLDGSPGAKGDKGDPGPGSIVSVAGASFYETTNTEWTDVTDAMLVTTAAGAATLLVTFSAESSCWTSAPPGGEGWCEVRVLVDGIEASPSTPGFAFDSTERGMHQGGPGSTYSQGGHSMQRFTTVAAGSHTVQLQAKVYAPAPPVYMSLDDWVLTVTTASSAS